VLIALRLSQNGIIMGYQSTIKPLLAALLVTGLLGLMGCDQTVNKQPEQSISIGQLFEDSTAATRALAGAYDGLQANGVYGGFPTMAADFTADIANFSGSFTTWQQAQAFNISSTHGPTQNIWADHYFAINRANLIIDNASDIEGLSQAGVDQFVGQAKFIRALAYFNLVRWFGQPFEPGASNDQPGVILATTGVQTTNPEFNQPRASVGDVYAQIRSDLEDAISNLDVRGARTRAGQSVANALLAKVSLYQGRWDEAASRAQSVIQQSEFELSGSPRTPYFNEASSEIIFQIAYSSTDNTGTNDFMSSFYLPGDLGGRGDINPLSSFLSDAESGDIRTGVSPAIEGDSLLYSQGGNIWTNKWTENSFSDDMPVLRVAEMYLIRAEGLARGSGTASDARTALNAVRNRAGLDDVASSLSGQDLIDEIITQRRYELAFEGDRRHDLQRLGRAINSGTGTLQPGDPQRILPIPNRAIQVNDALDQSSQNPGY
jgi:hypothetical protein